MSVIMSCFLLNLFGFFEQLLLVWIDGEVGFGGRGVVEDGGAGDGEDDEVEANVEPEPGKPRPEEVDRVRDGELEKVEGGESSNGEEDDPSGPYHCLQFAARAAALDNTGRHGSQGLDLHQ